MWQDKFWHKIYDDYTHAAAECVRCAEHRVDSVNSLLIFSCGEKVVVPMYYCENFDVERAKEVMDTLRDILDVDGIKWVDKSVENNNLDGTLFVILRTHITYHGKLYSVILGTGTYGCEKYKLELMAENVNGGQPVGYLTVTDVIDIMKNGYNPEV